MDAAKAGDETEKGRGAELGNMEALGNESFQLDSSLIFEVNLEDKLSSALRPLLSTKQESGRSLSDLPVPKSGSLRSLTKQLSAPTNDGEPVPLSPVSKKKLSLQRSGSGSLNLRCRSNSPGPIHSRQSRRNRTNSPGALARASSGRTRLGGSPGPLTRTRSGVGRLEGRAHSPGALTRTASGSGRLQRRTASPGALTRNCSGTGRLQRRTGSPGALSRTSGVRGRIQVRNTSPGPLTRASSGTGRLQNSGSPGPLTRTSSGRDRLEERALSPGPLVDEVPIIDEIDQLSVSGGLSRSFRASRRLSLTRKKSSKKALMTGPVSILRRGKFSRAPETPDTAQPDTGMTGRRQSLVLKDLSMSRRKRVTFLLPDDASADSSYGPEDSLQFGELFMDDVDCEVEVQCERRGPNALRFMEQMDMDYPMGMEMGDDDGWRLNGGEELEVVTERNSLSERESSGSLLHESHEGFQMLSGTTIQEEMGGQFGESFFGSIGSFMSDEESCLDSIEETKESPLVLESRKKRSGTEKGITPSSGNASFSSSSLLTDESLQGFADEFERGTPKSHNSRRKAGTEDVGTSKLSQATLDLSKVGDEDKKEGSIASETSSESPTGVVDYDPVEG